MTAIQTTVSEQRDLLRISRPRVGLGIALLFLGSALVVDGRPSVAVVLGVLYFLAPYGLVLFGLGPVDGADPLAVARAGRIRLAIAATNLPLLIAIVLLSGAAAGLALALAVGAAIAWSVPPLRTKARPVVDAVTGAMLVALPAAAGFLVAGLAVADLPWPALLAVGAWGVASYALRAIRDQTRDRAAGMATIATMLGGRWTAVVSLAGFALAATLSATYGPLGALAALGLDLYLLLPAMVLLSTHGDPAAEAAAARRAWSGFVGLDRLVGLWLALLLLRYLDVLGFTPWEIAIVTTAAVAGFALSNVVAIRLVTRRRRAPREVEDAAVATLTVIVPCRDEAERLPECLTALADQTYADTTVLVVDDGSTDGTAEIAADLLGGLGQVIVAPEKPPGWTGKNWACHVGANASSGDLLLFVDADTTLVPVAVRILVEQAASRRLDLLSGLTRFVMPTRSERIAVPGFALLLFGFVPIWLASLTRGRLPGAAFAYGPLLLVRREAYEATGGHGAAPASLRGDVDLARALTRAGRRVGSVHATDLGMTRYYPESESAFAAWRRVFVPYAGGSLAVAIATMLLETLAFLAPFILPILAFLTGAGVRTLIASLVPLLLLVAMRIVLALTQRQSFSTILWHPLTVGLTLVGQLAGIVDHVIGRAPRWRGRVVEPPGAIAEGHAVTSPTAAVEAPD